MKKLLGISALLLSYSLVSQSVTGVYKIDALLKRISHPDTTYIVNFWATWCKPCVQEIPAFDSLEAETKNNKIKIILVNLDFKEDLSKKVNAFLVKNLVKCECVLLDEINGNDFINKISTHWNGAIPATLFRKGATESFLEQKCSLQDLRREILKFR